MKKIPLGTPPITSYLFHAYPLSILAQEDRYLPWFYNTHIQLFSFPGEELKFYTHPFCTRHEIRHLYYQTCPLLNVQSIDRETLSPNPADLLSWVKDLIGQHYYVQIDIDFFHLPDKPHYQRCHFIHEILVSGYDETAQAFLTSGFDAQGKYTTTTVPFTITENALAWTKEDHRQKMLDSGKHLPPWFAAAMEDRPRVYLYKYLRDQTCLLDLTGMAEQLADYLDGRDTAERYRLLARPRGGGAWGMNVYKALKEHLEGLQDNGTAFSPIIWRILWEHKRCMWGRLYFLERQIFSNNVLSTRWQELVHRTNTLRLILLRLHRKNKLTSTAHAISLLAEIAERESDILGRLHRQL